MKFGSGESTLWPRKHILRAFGINEHLTAADIFHASRTFGNNAELLFLESLE